ncbi:hypothetical protein [Idiomarina aminovorans]|uniref:hypothetical protein n=1 Tax=Idiomarina aminovorans TaxID=2914829 RepID=UPI002003C558|nr:hypothetical protein [Idiomarina sp. ATCH4]MCK7458757.1 hypothetical protein [Idiomarina sp. ATCH4]
MIFGKKEANAPTRLEITYRIMLATFGGFIFTLIVTVFTPELFLWLFGWNKATSLLWMMLLSFGVYCGLVMWIIATRKLLKTSLILLVFGIALSIGFTQLQTHNSGQLAAPSEVTS